jgi:hypothetical protein
MQTIQPYPSGRPYNPKASTYRRQSREKMPLPLVKKML